MIDLASTFRLEPAVAGYADEYAADTDTTAEAICEPTSKRLLVLSRLAWLPATGFIWAMIFLRGRIAPRRWGTAYSQLSSLTSGRKDIRSWVTSRYELRISAINWFSKVTMPQY